MRKIAIIFLCVCRLAATTTTLADGNQSTIAAGITAATNGDTLIVPVGTYAWTTGVTVPNTKGLTIIASDGSTGSVHITRSSFTGYLFNVEWNSTHAFRISGFDFTASDSSRVMRMGYNNGSETTFSYPKGRIDHCVFKSTNLNSGYIGVEVYFGWPLIDHCTFTGDDASEMIHNVGYFDPFPATNFSALQATTGWLSTITLNDGNSTFVEDCVFSKYDLTDTSYNGCSAIQSYAGSRLTFRHNKLIYCQTDEHGTAGHVGARTFAFYNNTYEVPSVADGGGSGSHNIYSMMDLRAGTGVIHDETTTGGTNAGNGYMPQFREEDNGSTTGDTTAPYFFQIGRGANQVLDPTYYWNNTGKNVGTIVTGPMIPGTDVIASAKPGYTDHQYPNELGIPSVPTSPTATHSGTSTINVAWTIPTQVETAPQQGVQVERSLNGTTGWSIVNVASATATSYSDTGLTAGTTYYYRLSAFDHENFSAVTSNTSDTTSNGSAVINLGGNAKFGGTSKH